MSFLSTNLGSRYFNTTKNSVDCISNLKKRLSLVALTSCVIAITGCQTGHIASSNPTSNSDMLGSAATTPYRLDVFNIQGKIGITTPKTKEANAQAGSAFYAWAQEQDRFTVDITGAMGIGHTVIKYNGSTATLVSERTGEISADNPEELLTKATGWYAPISQLPYWISGHAAPSDVGNQADSLGRLKTAYNGQWTATFLYSGNNVNETLPVKIKVIRDDGHKVVMTIKHISR